MNRFRLALLGVALVAAISTTVSVASSSRPLRHQKSTATRLKFRWDLFSVDSTGAISPGATDSPKAGDGSKISLTGSGTFGGKPTNVTGGGSWTTSDASGKQTGNGTYTVKSLVSYLGGPGTLVGAPLTDKIGNLQDARGGLAVLRIVYSDGSQGVLTVSCNLSDAPDVFEGVTATKGIVSYWNPGEESPTLFHVVK